MKKMSLWILGLLAMGDTTAFAESGLAELRARLNSAAVEVQLAQQLLYQIELRHMNAMVRGGTCDYRIADSAYCNATQLPTGARESSEKIEACAKQKAIGVCEANFPGAACEVIGIDYSFKALGIPSGRSNVYGDCQVSAVAKRK